MSILDQINRLTAAKSSIVTSISNKGVTVPTGVKMEGMSALIDTIVPQENLDAVVAQQDSFITEQDTLIASIQSALEGKALGGSGGSIETCIVTVVVDAPIGEMTLYHIDANQQLQTVTFGMAGTEITVMKNSIVYLGCVIQCSGGASRIGTLGHACFVTGDGTISILI